MHDLAVSGRWGSGPQQQQAQKLASQSEPGSGRAAAAAAAAAAGQARTLEAEPSASALRKADLAGPFFFLPLHAYASHKMWMHAAHRV